MTMDTNKSALQIFEMCGCACIAGYLHITIQMEVLIETLKALSSDLRWWFCNIFLPRIALWLPLRMTNILLCFPGSVRSLNSTGTASQMPWYRRRIMVRFTDLTWLLIVGLVWLFSSIRVGIWINYSPGILLSLNPDPWKVLSSIFSKPSSKSNYC